MFTIRKKFTFEMAHMLSGSYSEECRNIHGHSYVMEVIIKSSDLNKDGMVIDFKLLKEIVKSEVVDLVDHAMILPAEVTSHALGIALDRLNSDKGIKATTVSYNPTAENMAKDFHDRIWVKLVNMIPSVLSLEIRLHETATGWASYRN